MAISSLNGAGIGAIAGLLKSSLIDKPREERDRRLAATTTRLSPFTHLKAQRVREANPFGDVLKYGLTGLDIAQQSQQNELNNKLLKKLTDGKELTDNVKSPAVSTPFNPELLRGTGTGGQGLDYAQGLLDPQGPNPLLAGVQQQGPGPVANNNPFLMGLLRGQ